MNLSNKQKQVTPEDKLMVWGGGGRGWGGINCKNGIDINSTVYKMELIRTYSTTGDSSILCSDLSGKRI